MKNQNHRNKAKKVKVAKEIDYKLLQDEMQQNNRQRKRNYKQKHKKADRRK